MPPDRLLRPVNTLGLLGGMSWESTAVYYRLLNQMARERLGGQHSASLLMWSADFAPIAALQAAGEWDAAARILADAARGLQGAGAKALIICANTMHLVAPQIAAAVAIPVLHVVDAVAADIRAAKCARPLLLGTRFTMEEAFYRERLRARGVEAVTPPAADRRALHAIIFDELVRGRFEQASRQTFIDIVVRAVAADGADGVILGCTEFGLLVQPGDLPVQAFDTTLIHARAGIEFALG
ncbi:MAG TPA: aspartate/glutamate racemase family protein [Caulobacteraceae bacterium]